MWVVRKIEKVKRKNSLLVFITRERLHFYSSFENNRQFYTDARVHDKKGDGNCENKSEN